QSGALPRVRRPGDEDEPRPLVEERLDHGREAELVQGRDPVGDDPDRRRQARVLAEDVDAEARDPFQRVCAVQLALRLEPGDLLVGEQLVEEEPDLLFGERPVFGALEHAVDAEHGRLPGAQVEVRGPRLLHDFEERVYPGQERYVFRAVKGRAGVPTKAYKDIPNASVPRGGRGAGERRPPPPRGPGGARLDASISAAP